MFCPNCGTQNAGTQSNCLRCGWNLEAPKKKLLLQTSIDARDEEYFADGFRDLIDTICGLEMDHGPGVSLRITIERIKK
ncbi:MAG: hypothetical protein ACXADB_03100 [Candidatus Hermodarchaeia archaeon]|jgi:hypothetical protein